MNLPQYADNFNIQKESHSLNLKYGRRWDIGRLVIDFSRAEPGIQTLTLKPARLAIFGWVTCPFTSG